VHAHGLHQLAVAIVSVVIASFREVRQRHTDFTAAIVEQAAQVEPVHIPGVDLESTRKDLLSADAVAAVAVCLCKVGPGLFEVGVDLGGALVGNDCLACVAKRVFAQTNKVPCDVVVGLEIKRFSEVGEAFAVIMHLVVDDTALVETLIVSRDGGSFREILDGLGILPQRRARLPAALPGVRYLGINLEGRPKVIASICEVALQRVCCAAPKVSCNELLVLFQQPVENVHALLVPTGVDLQIA